MITTTCEVNVFFPPRYPNSTGGRSGLNAAPTATSPWCRFVILSDTDEIDLTSEQDAREQVCAEMSGLDSLDNELTRDEHTVKKGRKVQTWRDHVSGATAVSFKSYKWLYLLNWSPCFSLKEIFHSLRTNCCKTLTGEIQRDLILNVRGLSTHMELMKIHYI